MKVHKLWKYFDVIKFLTLINGELYFARADKFKDKYEGAIPKQNYLKFMEQMSKLENKPEDFDIKREFIRRFNERRKKAAISCWHMDDNESAAMWEVYSRAGHGIAVATTIDKLKSISKPEGYEMELFKVEYIDFGKEFNDKYIDFELLPFKNKRKEFEYEHEFRIMLYKTNSHESKKAFNRSSKNNSRNINNFIEGEYISELIDLPREGVKVSIDTSYVIDEIIASPLMEQYEVEEIQKILDLINKQKGTSYTIRRSGLYEDLQY